MAGSVDIILPCYRPHSQWYQGLLGFYARAKEAYDLHFILVNDGSVSDELAQQVNALKEKGVPISYITYQTNQGKGYALRQGARAAKRPHVVYTDVDFPFTDESMLAVVHELVSGACDVAAGYRNESYYKNKMPVYRKLLSQLFRFFIRRVLGMPITDTQCGLKGFNQKGKEKFLETTINRYLFDFEFIHAVVKDPALTIKTVPVQLKENVVFSKMKLKVMAQETVNLLSVLLFRKHKG